LLAGDDGTLRAMRKIFTGGAPVFPSLLSDLRTHARDAQVEAVFGSTEAEPIAHIEEREISGGDRAAMLAGKGLLAGKPVSEIQLRILRDRWGTPLGSLTAREFAAAISPLGDAGEIVVSGGHVLPGYLHGHGNDETKFHVDGTVWHRTGDAGWLDASGRLWLLGRCSAKIDRGDTTLWPFAVECAARNLPAVMRAALVEIKGRCILAVATSKTHPSVLDQLRERLAWANLDEIRPVSRIPVDKRHNAKIDYPALRAMLGRSEAR
jgi:acyl-CoA synthetase (AMP-forming)/AMP-acid ligase II